MSRAFLVAAMLQFGGAVAADEPDLATRIMDAIADPARSADQVALDRDRKPGELIAFAGLKAGDRVADFMSGGGYFTRMFSRIVGETGRVYAFLPEEQLANCAPAETDGTRALGADSRYANVTIVRAPVGAFHISEPLDAVWTSDNYHDLHDAFMGPADVATLNRAIYDALKPGGVFIVVDHVAEAGSELRDTNTLHRIDPSVIVREVEAAGFRLEAQSDVLRNPDDTHTSNVFDPSIRGRTDQVVLKFARPGVVGRP